MEEENSDRIKRYDRWVFMIANRIGVCELSKNLKDLYKRLRSSETISSQDKADFYALRASIFERTRDIFLYYQRIALIKNNMPEQNRLRNSARYFDRRYSSAFREFEKYVSRK